MGKERGNANFNLRKNGIASYAVEYLRREVRIHEGRGEEMGMRREERRRKREGVRREERGQEKKRRRNGEDRREEE